MISFKLEKHSSILDKVCQRANCCWSELHLFLDDLFYLSVYLFFFVSLGAFSLLFLWLKALNLRACLGVCGSSHWLCSLSIALSSEPLRQVVPHDQLCTVSVGEGVLSFCSSPQTRRQSKERSLACCNPCGRKESDTTEQLNWTDNREKICF